MSQVSTNILNITKQLRQAGVKVTPARLGILHVLEKYPKPSTAAQIKQELGYAQIDLVTIYRNLELFEKLRIIKKVLIKEDEAYYEYQSKHHHHLVCQICGKFEDFEQCNTKGLIEQTLKHSKNFQAVTEHSLELFGICNTCH